MDYLIEESEKLKKVLDGCNLLPQMRESLERAIAEYALEVGRTMRENYSKGLELGEEGDKNALL